MSLQTPELLRESQAASHAMAFGNCVSLLREPDARDRHVRFDERDVETEHGPAIEAPADERAGNR